jgi:hypothetical protein
MGIVLAVGVMLASLPPSPVWATTGSSPYRAYKANSYWNAPLPTDVPIDPSSSAMIRWLDSHASDKYVTLSGTDSQGSYGQPIYWARQGAPTYAVTGASFPEFSHLRIPLGAKPDPTGDGEMVVFDRGSGWVAWLAGADFDGTNWTVSGGSISYLASNGLDGKLPESNEPRNAGHRGFPAADIAYRYDEVQYGKISHVIKLSIPDTCGHVFPMAGDEGCNASSPFPEGTRVRIKASVDLTKLGLTPGAMVVAKALQRYGAVVGDQSGGSVVAKLENTVAEGRGQLWTNVLNRNSLQAIPLTDLEVVKLGWGA